LIVSNLKLCADLSAGAFRDEEELDELGGGAALETFGDVGHDGD